MDFFRFCGTGLCQPVLGPWPNALMVSGVSLMYIRPHCNMPMTWSIQAEQLRKYIHCNVAWPSAQLVTYLADRSSEAVVYQLPKTWTCLKILKENASITVCEFKSARWQKEIQYMFTDSKPFTEVPTSTRPQLGAAQASKGWVILIFQQAILIDPLLFQSHQKQQKICREPYKI